MFRTKHLFVFLVGGACAVIAVGVWVLVRDTSTTSSDTLNNASTFLSAPENTYGVIVATDEAKKEKNIAFIERIRAALKKELPTVIESQIEEERDALSTEQKTEPEVTQEELATETVIPPAESLSPASEVYVASTTPPRNATTSTTTEQSVGNE